MVCQIFPLVRKEGSEVQANETRVASTTREAGTHEERKHTVPSVLEWPYLSPARKEGSEVQASEAIVTSKDMKKTERHKTHRKTEIREEACPFIVESDERTAVSL